MPISPPRAARAVAALIAVRPALVFSAAVAPTPAFAPPPAELTGRGLSSVVPALRSVEPTVGTAPWILRSRARVLMPADREGLRADAQLFVNELRTVLSSPDIALVSGSPADAESGFIALAVDPALDIPSDEEYRIEVGKTVLITGKTPAGGYWGTRGLLQSVPSSGGAEAALVTAFVDRGYNLINFNDKYMYYVLHFPGGAYHERPKPENVCNEFAAGILPTNHQHTQHQRPRPYPQWLRGASFAIWSDNASMETGAEVVKSSRPLIDAFADRSWNADDAWIQIDLATPTTVEKVKLSWQKVCAPAHAVSVRTASGEWVALGDLSVACPVGKTTVGAEEIPASVGSPVSAIEVQAKSRKSFGGTFYGISLWEVEAFTPAAPLPVPPPTVDGGRITWTGDLLAGGCVGTVWRGSAPAAAEASLPIRLNARLTQAINAGEASTEIVHAVAPAPPSTPVSPLTAGSPSTCIRSPCIWQRPRRTPPDDSARGSPIRHRRSRAPTRSSPPTSRPAPRAEPS